MSASGHDLFISYASADLARVEPFVLLFQQHGLRVFLDRSDVGQGRWGGQIETALDGAKWVVAFLSRAACESGYVFTEMDRARKAGKLVPVRLDNAPLKFEFEGLTALLQRIDVSQVADPLHSPQGRQLIQICEGSPTLLMPPRDQRLEEWMLGDAVVPNMAYLLALSVFENEAHTRIQSMSDRLSARMKDLGMLPASPSGGAAMLSKSQRLALLQAEICKHQPHGLQLSMDCVRFQDENRATRILEVAWDELDHLHRPLIDWLSELAAMERELGRFVALRVGLLAQKNFFSVLQEMILPWALDENPARRHVADLALAIAAMAPEVADAVAKVLADLSQRGTTPADIEAALVFSCGHTGLRMPDVALQSLQGLARVVDSGRVSRQGRKELIAQAARAVQNLIRHVDRESEDDLFDLPRFLCEFSRWAADHQNDGHAADLPDALMLSALGAIRVGRAGKDGEPEMGLSLLKLFDGPNGQDVLQAIANALGRMLAQGSLRQEATELLARWLREDMPDPASPKDVASMASPDEALLRLARALWACAPTQRDRDRIVFTFRHRYTEALLDSLTLLT